MPTIILRLRKVEFLNLLNKHFFIGFIKFKTKQDQFCVWFILAQLPTETARVFFLSHILKKGFFLLPPASRTCSMPRQDFFVSLPYHVKYYLIFKTFSRF